MKFVLDSCIRLSLLIFIGLLKITTSIPVKVSLVSKPGDYEVLEVIDEGEDIKTRGPPVLGNIIRDTYYRWPSTTIPIAIGSDLNMKGVAAVRDAMYNYGMRTCIKLVEWNGRDYPYISIYPIGGCFSHVGWGFPAQQNISIGSGCEVPGKVQHEIFHALGAYHTHSSPERDEYVDINFYNIKEGKEHNFDKYPFENETTVNQYYDYESVMHYSSGGFAINTSIPTIAPKHDYFLGIIGQRNGFSQADLAKIDKMYSCGGQSVFSSFSCSFEEEPGAAMCGIIQGIPPFIEDGESPEYFLFDGWTRCYTHSTTKTLDVVECPSELTFEHTFANSDSSGNSLVSYQTENEHENSSFTLKRLEAVFDYESEDNWMSSQGKGQCLQLWSFMSQNYTGQLTFKIYQADETYYGQAYKGTERKLSSVISNEIPGKWRYQQVSVDNLSEFELSSYRLTVTSEGYGQGFVAIDDVIVNDGPCNDLLFQVDDFSEVLKASGSGSPIHSEVAFDGEGHGYGLAFYDVPEKEGVRVGVTVSNQSSVDARWPWLDMSFTLKIIDQQTNQRNRLDYNKMLLSEAGSIFDNAPGTEWSGTLGWTPFISYFNLYDTHNYIKQDTVVFSIKLRNMANTVGRTSLLDQCDLGCDQYELKACLDLENTGEIKCVCAPPFVAGINGECVCPPGYGVRVDSALDYRDMCVSICELYENGEADNTCKSHETCMNAVDGIRCYDLTQPEPTTTEEVETDAVTTDAVTTEESTTAKVTTEESTTGKVTTSDMPNTAASSIRVAVSLILPILATLK